MGKIDGKVAVVTGAASGMGLAIVRRFLSEGASVILGDIDAAAGQAALKKLPHGNGRALFVQADVTDPADAEKLVAAALKEFGKLDIAANMAGTPLTGGLFAPIAERDRCMAVNVSGTFNCVTAEVAAMRRTGGGAIVNCSSVGGMRGSGYSPYYCAAKHAVIGFTKSVAIEMAAAGIRVNAICPGLTRSKMTEEVYAGNVDALASHVPLGRIGEPEDQANAVLWLCSDESSFVTGAVISVDGGQMAGNPLTLKPANNG